MLIERYVLSPKLFNVYIDGLSNILNNCTTGGFLGGKRINHMLYADDLCIVSLSSAGLQNLLSICDKYCASHSVVWRAGTRTRVCCELLELCIFRLVMYDCKISCLANIFPKQLGTLFYNWILDFTTDLQAIIICLKLLYWTIVA